MPPEMPWTCGHAGPRYHLCLAITDPDGVAIQDTVQLCAGCLADLDSALTAVREQSAARRKAYRTHTERRAALLAWLL